MASEFIGYYGQFPAFRDTTTGQAVLSDGGEPPTFQPLSPNQASQLRPTPWVGAPAIFSNPLPSLSTQAPGGGGGGTLVAGAAPRIGGASPPVIQASPGEPMRPPSTRETAEPMYPPGRPGSEDPGNAIISGGWRNLTIPQIKAALTPAQLAMLPQEALGAFPNEDLLAIGQTQKDPWGWLGQFSGERLSSFPTDILAHLPPDRIGQLPGYLQDQIAGSEPAPLEKYVPDTSKQLLPPPGTTLPPGVTPAPGAPGPTAPLSRGTFPVVRGRPSPRYRAPTIIRGDTPSETYIRTVNQEQAAPPPQGTRSDYRRLSGRGTGEELPNFFEIPTTGLGQLPVVTTQPGSVVTGDTPENVPTAAGGGTTSAPAPPGSSPPFAAPSGRQWGLRYHIDPLTGAATYSWDLENIPHQPSGTHVSIGQLIGPEDLQAKTEAQTALYQQQVQDLLGKLQLAQQNAELAVKKQDFNEERFYRQQEQQLQLQLNRFQIEQAQFERQLPLHQAGITGYYGGEPTLGREQYEFGVQRASSQDLADAAYRAAQIALQQGNQAEAQRQFDLSDRYRYAALGEQSRQFDVGAAQRAQEFQFQKERSPASAISQTFALRGQQVPQLPQPAPYQAAGAGAGAPSGAQPAGTGAESGAQAATSLTPLTLAEVLASPYTGPGLKAAFQGQRPPTPQFSAPLLSAQARNTLLPSELAERTATVSAMGSNPEDIQAQESRLTATTAPPATRYRVPLSQRIHAGI